MPKKVKREHTPGPWEIHWGGNFIRVGGPGHLVKSEKMHYLGHKAGSICELDLPFPGEIKDSRAQADARLIAAAPDLLAACRAMVRFFNGLQFDPSDSDHQTLRETAMKCKVAIALTERGKNAVR